MSNTQTQTQTQRIYSDLTARGTGFLNRIRKVQSKKGDGYWAATLKANRGEKGEFTNFEVRAVGADAKALFAGIAEQFPKVLSGEYKERPSVFCGFSIGDIQPMSYTKDGKEVLYIDARLLKFSFININGNAWYSANNPDLQPVELPSSKQKQEETTEEPAAKAA